MHDGMPYDSIQGQGHECLKATQEEYCASLYIVCMRRFVTW